MFETVDELKESMRQKRLTLTKLAKTEKDRIRIDINQTAIADFQLFITEVSKGIMPIQLLSLTSFDADFNKAMKGKSTIDSLQNCVDTKLAELKIEVNEVVSLITTNLNSLKALASDHKFLFNDTPHLVLKANEDLVNLIKLRISEHETEKAAEAEKQRQAIQKEEERKATAKAEREAQAELERKEQVIRDEERVKVEREQAAIAAHEAELQANSPEFCGSEFPNDEPLQALPMATKQTSVDKEVTPANESSNVAQKLAERFGGNQAKTFTVRVEWSGYSRGYSVYEVEASSEQEAKECYYEGIKVQHEVVRDDTERQEVNIMNAADKAA